MIALSKVTVCGSAPVTSIVFAFLNTPVPRTKGYFVAAEQAFDAANITVDDKVFARGDLAVVKGHIIRKDTKLGALFRILIELGRMQQGFGGDTTAVQTGAAHGVLLDQDRLEPELRAGDRSDIAAGAAARTATSY